MVRGAMEANPERPESEGRAALSARMSRLAKRKRVKPESRLLRHGLVHGSSQEGLFLRSVEKRLREGLGHEASFAEDMLIRRAARLLLQLELMDRKPHPLSEHDLRTAAAWENRARLLLVTLNGKRNGGLERKVAALAESKPARAPKPAPAAPPEPKPKPESLADIVAEHDGSARADDAGPP